jgi:signal transduction histidine kinase/ActR/RegA family two-component response regulator
MAHSGTPMAEVLHTGLPQRNREAIIERPDGSHITVIVNIDPIRDGTGVLVGAVNVFQDITQRERAERYRAVQLSITQILAEAATMSDAAPRLLQTTCESLGWVVGALWSVDPEADVLRCVEVWHTPPIQVPRFEAASRERTFSRGIGLPGRIWATAAPTWIKDVVADGNFPRAPIAAQEGLHGAFGYPIVLADEVLGVIEFFSSEVREPDGMLLEMMAGLGGQLGQFIRRGRAEQALRDAHRRKDEFLAMLAHELRNPLAPIRNALEVVQAKCPPTPELQWTMDTIDRQLRQMVRLVDDLLDVSRITRGRIELRRQPTTLRAIVETALESSRPVMEEFGHELAVSLPAEPIWVNADPTRMAQVLTNLLNNAAKYTDPGGHVRLSVAREDQEAVVAVRDDGTGIPPDMLRAVFDMFTQVDRSLERSQGGLGIGLTLVQKLVELHGGSVYAQSDGTGQGSEFVVRVPVMAAEPGAHEPAVAAEIKAGTPGGHRVLVVDDNLDSAKTLAMLMTMLGNEVRTAHDGLQAVEMAAEFRPHVALLDIGLPKLNGYEAARRIRENPLGREIMLIAVTGWGKEEDRCRSQEAGFDHHLTKPVELATLQQLLASCAADASPQGIR